MRRWRVIAGLASLALAAALTVLTPSGGQAAPNVLTADRAVGEREAASTRSQLGLSPGERLVPRYVVRDRDGTVHTRYDRTYKGLPVIGGDLVVHRSPTGKLGVVDWASEADLDGLRSITPTVSSAAAAAVARRSTNLRSTASDARLVVYAIGDRARLAWEATAAEGLDRREVVYVNAANGTRIAGWSLVEHADGTGRSLYSGTVRVKTVKPGRLFKLRDNSRGGQRVLNSKHRGGFPPTGTLFSDRDNVWGNGRPSNAQSAAVDAHYGAAKTWDFFKSRFNRRGIRNDGVGARSFVHYRNNYANAFWSDECFCMVYGDGNASFRPLVSLDVAGHEMSHGVMSHTAGLIYNGESGGLNEASSDIFGTMVEFFARNTKDKGDYYIGEKIVKTSPRFLRRMDRPALDGASYPCWTPRMGRDDVHFTSGPANRFFYLLAEGTGPKAIGGRPHNGQACNGTGITGISGIGRTPAARIWYRAVNIYMTSTTNYTVARDATIRAARNLFGAGSSRCRRVVRAWNAVKVPAGDWRCTGTPPAHGGNVVVNPGFESGSTGWSATAGVITNSSVRWPRSGSRYAFMNGFGTSHVDTVEQAIAVPNSANARLRFWLWVESVDSATRVFDTLRVRIVAGGTSTLATYSNRQANNTYTRKVVDLSAYAGQNVTLRFVGTEDVTAYTAFLLDDVRVTPN